MALPQPTLMISAAAMGAMMNWPKEAPALTMPTANPSFSGGIMRAAAEISTAGPATPAPPAASTAMEKIRPAVVVMKGVMNVPTATSSMPTSSTLPGPPLSATAPAKGCASPQKIWPKAKARLICARPKPVAVLMGLKNSPMV